MEEEATWQEHPEAEERTDDAVGVVVEEEEEDEDEDEDDDDDDDEPAFEDRDMAGIDDC